jgi:hypothetical protein
VIGDGLVIDTAVLTEAAGDRTSEAAGLIYIAMKDLRTVCVPTNVLMEGWSHVPERSQVFLAMFVNLPVVVVDPLGQDDAVDAGVRAALAGRQRRARCDLKQAVQVARQRGWPLVTRDVDAARALGPDVRVRPLG